MNKAVTLATLQRRLRKQSIPSIRNGIESTVITSYFAKIALRIRDGALIGELAEELGVTKSTITTTVRRCEQKLKTRLFDRRIGRPIGRSSTPWTAINSTENDIAWHIISAWAAEHHPRERRLIF